MLMPKLGAGGRTAQYQEMQALEEQIQGPNQ